MGAWVQLEEFAHHERGTAVTSVAISSSGNRVAVGVALENQVFLFDWTGSQWTRINPDVSILDGADGETFGSSVALALDGARVVVGSSWNSSVSETGSIHLYDLTPRSSSCG